MNGWAQLAVLAVAFVGFYCLTRPEETRDHRWLRIGVSLVLIWIAVAVLDAGLSYGMVALFPILAFLGFLWSGVLSHYSSGMVVNFLNRDISSVTGGKPDYRFAKNHRRDGEMKEAIAAIEHELTKDEKNFEGRMLLAEIQQDLNNPEAALAHVDIILRNPESTPAQVKLARREKERCAALRRRLEEAAFFEKQNAKR